jgi:hypothetical protein
VHGRTGGPATVDVALELEPAAIEELLLDALEGRR